MLYLDTSVLVASVSREIATTRVQDWLEQQTKPLAISDWSIAEFASALAAKQRADELSPAERAGGLQWLRSLSEEGAALWPVSRSAFRRAADLVNAAGVKVRASHALHLAVAEEFGASLCTLDQEQAEAGNMVAIAAVVV